MTKQILPLDKEKYLYLLYSNLAKYSKTNFKRLHANSNYVALYFCAFLAFLGTSLSAQTSTYGFTGASQTVVLPPGTHQIECWGADGGETTSNTGLPGRGGYSSGTISLSSATSVTIYVGGKGNATAQPLGGFNSGNTTTKTNLGTATGGGGASDLRVLIDDYFHRIIVAGGGGGQGTSTGTGGNGGGLVGQNGQGTVTNIGMGGTQTAPGVYPGGGSAKPAAFGEGGDGPAGTTGGQGGGGWYGGSFGTRTNGGGGGGSGYVLTSTSFKPTGYFSAHASYYFTNDITLRADEVGFVPNPITTGHGYITITTISKSPDDAGIKSVVGLSDTSCAGTYPVSVVVKNFGNNAINNVSVDWTLDGVAQTGATVSSVIDTANGNGPDSAIVSLGSVTISAATDIKVWTTIPNGNSDPNNTNDTLVLNVTHPVSAVTQVLNAVSCNGLSDGSARVVPSNGKPNYTILWSNSSTNGTISSLTAGSYSVTVTDARGCSTTESVNVPEPSAISIAPNVTHVTAVGNDGVIDLVVSGGVPPYTYLWDNMATTKFITGLSVGTYKATVTDSTGCQDSVEVSVMSTVGINQLNEKVSYEVFPNPSENGLFTVMVTNAKQPVNIEVLTMLGERVLYVQNAEQKTTHQLESEPGVYLIKIANGEDVVIERLIVH